MKVMKWLNRFDYIVLAFVMLLYTAMCCYANAALPKEKNTKTAIDLSLQHMPLTQAILLLAKAAHQNVILSDKIIGNVSFHFNHEGCQEALRLLLRSNQLEKIRIGHAYYIAPITELIQQQHTANEYVQAQEKLLPLLMFVRRLKYTNVSTLANIIQDGQRSFISSRGNVKVDKRTNSIAIQDSIERINFIKKLIQQLDVPTQQIVIEARIASIDSDCERELGLQFDAYTSKQLTQTNPNLKQWYPFVLAHLTHRASIDIKLAALELEGKAELISNPKLSTTNGEAASIEAGEEVPYQEVSESGGTAVTFKKAVLGLKVVPEVLAGNNLLLKLQINQDRPSHKLIQGVPTINTRKIVSNAFLKSGETIVLGGIYESNYERGRKGIPYLMDVPLIGWLFQTKHKRLNKRELIILVTPRIIAGSQLSI